MAPLTVHVGTLLRCPAVSYDKHVFIPKCCMFQAGNSKNVLPLKPDGWLMNMCVHMKRRVAFPPSRRCILSHNLTHAHTHTHQQTDQMLRYAAHTMATVIFSEVVEGISQELNLEGESVSPAAHLTIFLNSCSDDWSYNAIFAYMSVFFMSPPPPRRAPTLQ